MHIFIIIIPVCIVFFTDDKATLFHHNPHCRKKNITHINKLLSEFCTLLNLICAILTSIYNMPIIPKVTHLYTLTQK